MTAWILEGFDRKTDELVEDHQVPVTDEDVRSILVLPPDDDLHSGGYEVKGAALERFGRILGRPLRPELFYVIECCELQSGPAKPAASSET